MSEQRQERIKFDSFFLKAAACRLIGQPHLIEKYRKFLDPDLFYTESDGGALRNIVRYILEISKTEKLDMQGLHAKIAFSHDSEVRTKSLELLNEIKLDEDLWKYARSDEVFNTFLQYIKAIVFLENHRHVKQKFDNADFETAYHSLEDVLAKIKTISMEESETANWDTVEEYFRTNSVAVDNNQNLKNMFLGIKDYDDIGGFEPQTLNMFISTSGGGKSMMTVHLILQAIREGKKIYVVCVEDRQISVLRRVYAALTGLEINQIKKFNFMPREHIEKFKEATRKLKEYVHIDFLYNQSHLAILEKVKNVNAECHINGKARYEVLVIDYLQHIGHLAPGDSLHEKLHRANSDLKDFALKHNMICFTHFQVNRAGAENVNKENLIDMSVISGSYNACFVADNIISINRSPEQRQKNLCTLYVLKGREGGAECKFEIPTAFEKARYYMEDYKTLEDSSPFSR